MKLIESKTFDEERALYGSRVIEVDNCRFEGPADGESALKESSDLVVRNSYFDLRYPFWHDDKLKIEGCTMTEKCRAALWYSKYVEIADTKLHGIKALRECDDVTITDCDIVSPEFGWSTRGIRMRNTVAESEYFMMRSDHLDFKNVTLKGKYSFQYITDSVFTGCVFDTKDAFWHAKNVIVRDSVVRGEYLAWYSENVTFENCTIEGTQPLCYCKGLRLINCRMVNCDLAFEKSEVYADITSTVDSIKNPRKGSIIVSGIGELIFDDPDANGTVVADGEKITA